MSTDPFTIFSKTVPIAVMCVVFYSGCFDSIDAAQGSGEPVYRTYVKYLNLILSSVEIDFDDNATLVAGTMSMAKSSDRSEATAVVDMRTKRSAKVTVQNMTFKLEQRATQLGWKFKDASGTDYKWNTPIKGNRWELRDGNGSVVATLNIRKFHPEKLEIRPTMDKQLRTLVLTSLISCIVTVASQEPNYTNVAYELLRGY
ncbi:hypothetical protein DL89DRAFT_270897 [Linderina pennispora]|uniref:DUF6593 domain-containing protein n=1 Tax=Linderina pennispora TaxID=61395 RepID=A0A1Y1VW64_9FUNG|nr:uncharacterized protein DL89DRAFT_270897 [Linderina pennispora]ORX65531.1 hypothetical protein DL89DRAFT_270897 [Linderina pennispora]